MQLELPARPARKHRRHLIASLRNTMRGYYRSLMDEPVPSRLTEFLDHMEAQDRLKERPEGSSDIDR
jgi:hypothetical protein